MAQINPNIGKIWHDKGQKLPSAEYYINGIASGDVHILAQAITLLESGVSTHLLIVNSILSYCLNKKQDSRRIGITGPPGVGKSTFIESFVNAQLDHDQKVAVLSVDPSSVQGRGSILGDKTRMNKLSQQANVFIRPSPTGSHLGGVNAHTYESIVLCEAAGYDLIFVETVGVGQSEQDINNLVDLTMLIMQPGGGDELQGIKKGIIEVAEMIIINKADGNSRILAEKSRGDVLKAGQLSSSHHFDWTVPVILHSSVTQEGQEELKLKITEYFAAFQNGDQWKKHRNRLYHSWLTNRWHTHCCQKFEEKLMSQKIINDQLKKALTSPDSFDQVNTLLDQLQIDINY